MRFLFPKGHLKALTLALEVQEARWFYEVRFKEMRFLKGRVHSAGVAGKAPQRQDLSWAWGGWTEFGQSNFHKSR